MTSLAPHASTVTRPHEKAVREIDADPHQFLAVIRNDGWAIVETMQLTTIPGLARASDKRRPSHSHSALTDLGHSRTVVSGI